MIDVGHAPARLAPAAGVPGAMLYRLAMRASPLATRSRDAASPKVALGGVPMPAARIHNDDDATTLTISLVFIAGVVNAVTIATQVGLPALLRSVGRGSLHHVNPPPRSIRLPFLERPGAAEESALSSASSVVRHRTELPWAWARGTREVEGGADTSSRLVHSNTNTSARQGHTNTRS